MACWNAPIPGGKGFFHDARWTALGTRRWHTEHPPTPPSRETVPQMTAAGMLWIVPGSLMFQDDPAEMHAWPANLEAPDYVKV